MDIGQSNWLNCIYLGWWYLFFLGQFALLVDTRSSNTYVCMASLRNITGTHFHWLKQLQLHSNWLQQRRLFWCDRTWPYQSKVWTFGIIKPVLFQGLIHQNVASDVSKMSAAKRAGLWLKSHSVLSNSSSFFGYINTNLISSLFFQSNPLLNKSNKTHVHLWSFVQSTSINL